MSAATPPPANTPKQWRLSQLNQTIEQIESDIAATVHQRSELARTSRRARRKARYLKLAQAIRAPSNSWEMWPIGLLTVGPLVTGIIALLLIDLLGAPTPFVVLGFLVGVVGGGGALAMLLFRPANAVLAAAIGDATTALELAESILNDADERLAFAHAKLRDLSDERRELMASGKVQRAALLQREWKTMPETEWEDFVVEVCRTLGAEVDRLPRSRDAGAQLLANFAGRRVAIVTAGEGKVVNSNAVQQALAAKKQHAADSCAVVVNRRLTGAAQDFARQNRCVTVAVDEFPDFAMGQLAL